VKQSLRLLSQSSKKCPKKTIVGYVGENSPRLATLIIFENFSLKNQGKIFIAPNWTGLWCNDTFFRFGMFRDWKQQMMTI
jgi:hypothetical protein